MALCRQQCRGHWAPAAGIFVLLALVWGTPAQGADSPREVAAERYRYARLLLDDLNSVPEVELGEAQYLLVIEAFKKVHRTSPASGYCDDALLQAANLYREMIGRFGANLYKDKSVAAYEFLISQYPHSKLLDSARQAIAEIEQGVPAPDRRANPPADEPEDEPVVAEAEDSPFAEAPDPAAAATPPASDGAAETAAVEGQEPLVAIQSSRSVALPVAAKPKTSNESATGKLEGVRFWSNPDYTRVVIELDDRTEVSYDQLQSPKRLFFDLLDTRLGAGLEQESKFEVGDSFLKRIRAAQYRRNSTRVVFDLERSVYFDVVWLSNPARLVVEVRESDEPALLTRAAPEAGDRRPAETAGLAGRAAPVPVSTRTAEQSFALALDRTLGGTGAASSAPASSAPASAPVQKTEPAAAPPAPKENPPETAPAPVEVAKLTPPPAPDPRVAAPELPAPIPASANTKGKRSLIRALGLKVGRVVIDAGHGGRDPGSIGPTGLQEKEPVLDIAMRLGKLIEEGLGSEVIYTRTDDSYISPSARPRLANEKQADLFISIHTNSSPSRTVRGIETYYLNFTTDSWALTVASRENAASDRSVHELQDLLSKIALKEKIEESEEFATRIQEALHSGLSEGTKGLRDRGVRKAPLMVLIGAKMPAILAEIGFISNPQTEKLLKSSAYRQKVANYLYQGMLSYAESLGNISMATEAGEQ
jgi:N-acetylmuramoyl-L-alanine amidase